MQNVANQPPHAPRGRSARCRPAAAGPRQVRASETRSRSGVAPRWTKAAMTTPAPADVLFRRVSGLVGADRVHPHRIQVPAVRGRGQDQAAGSIVTTQPADWTTFPQTYSSRYEFRPATSRARTALYENTVNADYSGRSKYENVYADGGHEPGPEHVHRAR
jgi:hypothetical protein